MKQLFIALGLWILTSTTCQAQVGLFIRPNSSSLSSPVSGQTWFFNSTNYTTSCWNGSAFQLTSAPLNNFTASANPTTSNDNTEGYSPASLWYNTVNGNTYECVDATTSAAIWIQTNNLGGLTIPLTQLSTSGASTGQSIIFNGTHWAPGSPNVLLSQVLQSGASTGQIPIWNGSAWVPGTTSGSGAVALGQLTQSGAVSGDIIQSNGSSWQAVNPATALRLSADNQLVTSLGGNPTGSWGWVSANSTTYNSSGSINNSDPTFIYVDSSGGAVTLTLPDANDVLGKVYTIIPINFTNAITIQTDSGVSDVIRLYGQTTTVGSITLDPTANNAYPLVLTADGAGPPGVYIQLTPIIDSIISTQNASFSAIGNNTYYVDVSGSNVTATLPDATLCAGQRVKIMVTVAGNTLSLATTSSQNINGAAPSQSIMNAGDFYVLESDGSNWWIFGSNTL